MLIAVRSLLIIVVFLTAMSVQSRAEGDINAQSYGIYDPCFGKWIGKTAQEVATMISEVPGMEWVRQRAKEAPFVYFCICSIDDFQGWEINREGEIKEIRYKCAWCNVEFWPVRCDGITPFVCCRPAETWSVCASQWTGYSTSESGCDRFFGRL